MIKVIKKVTKEDFKKFIYEDMYTEDPKVIDEVNTNNYIGIFQMGGKTAKRLISEIKPSNFAELNACNAMARPGPIENAPLYIVNKNGARSSYPKEVQEILSESHNVFLFQEQIMRVFQVLGNFSLEESDGIRNLMKRLSKADKKKEDMDAWNKSMAKFKKNSLKLGYTDSDVRKITEDVLKFAEYSFNKSHSIAYTYIAYICLYLSVYFRKFYYSSVLEYELDRGKEIMETINSISSSGFEILPPDINESAKFVKPASGNKMILGFSDMKGVGEEPSEKIMENRPYKSIIDFIIKTKGMRITATVIRALIKSGAFDNTFGGKEKRGTYLNIYEEFYKNKKNTKIEEKIVAQWEQIEKSVLTLPLLPTPEDDLRSWEKEIFNFNYFNPLFSHNITAALNKMEEKGLIVRDLGEVGNYSYKVPVVINKIRTIIDKNGNEMAFMEVEDMSGISESIPVFASYWKFIKQSVEVDHLYLMNLFRGERGNILFGSSGFGHPENKIRRMVKLIK
jgi:DNA polymerase III subunit alpha